jgi:hypothetical protein
MYKYREDPENHPEQKYRKLLDLPTLIKDFEWDAR